MKLNMRGSNRLLDCFAYAIELDTSCKRSRPIVLKRALEYVVSCPDIDIARVQKYREIKHFSCVVPENVSIEVDSVLFKKVKDILSQSFPDTNLRYPFICRIALTAYIMRMNECKGVSLLDTNVKTSSRNESLRWALEEGIVIDSRIINIPDLRGIYGIFVGDECQYVGRSYSIYARMFKGDCHIRALRNGIHISKIQEGFEQGNRIEIKVLETVEYNEDNHPAKESQRLASRECWWIDYFQEKDQCLEQYPEGRWK